MLTMAETVVTHGTARWQSGGPGNAACMVCAARPTWCVWAVSSAVSMLPLCTIDRLNARN